MSPKFQKDLRTVSQYKNFKKDRLAEYTKLLANGENLPENARDHKLSKNSPEKYKGLRNFHVAPDICVLYYMDDNMVHLVRIGKHNDLGMTESLINS